MTQRPIMGKVLVVLLCLTMTCLSAHAAVALLMEEPYGFFGAVNPTGHAAIYLNHVCAETPLQLRPCHDGEYGVVISRYHKIDGYDWIAIPLLGYLYSVDHLDQIPATANRAQMLTLQNAYRREHLLKLAPDHQGHAPGGEWVQLVGESYLRTIYGFQFDSTPEEDERFIALFNDRRNIGHFNLFFHNCADFSRVVLNTYMPRSVHRNFIADIGLMTPKQVARSLMEYDRKNPQLRLQVFVIPQVPGTIPRSHPVDGVAESLVKSKKYIIPLAVLNPELAGGAVVAYLADGRMQLPAGATVFHPADERVSGVPDPPARPPLVTALPEVTAETAYQAGNSLWTSGFALP